MIDQFLGLPVPPSLNNSFYPRRDGKGMAKTTHYKQWQRVAFQNITVAKMRRGNSNPPLQSVGKHYEVSIICGLNHKSDIDNIIKPTLDVLSKAKITPDDSWCDFVCIRRRKGHDRETITITLRGETL
jgi:Holliday junction resolvase RusA-like endonuclease